MNIVEAIRDERLLKPFFGTLETWRPWLTALRALYGLPIRKTKSCQLVKQCTGRSAATLPADAFSAALYLTGRRSGKSRVSAAIAAFEAVLAGHQRKLAKGERGVVPVVAPTKNQGRIVRDYIRAIFDLPLLQGQLAGENAEGFELRDGTRIEIMAGNFRTVRGYSLLAAVVDEVAFFGLEETSRVSDTELIRALKPSLATVGGKLIAISSPYARRGWSYQTFQKHHANATGSVLVWNAPSRTMNSTLPQRVVDEALAEDYQAAKSEYLGEFRDDVAAFITREIVESLVAKGCPERLPRKEIEYLAFADLSGGRADDAALAISHRELTSRGLKVVVDYVKRWKPPFDPMSVIGQMANDLRKYNLRRVIGDNYAAEFVAKAFQANGIKYAKSELPKSSLYMELLPRLCSGLIELPDNEILISQLANLERRTRAGGRDIVDHPAGGHDDLANVVAGVACHHFANKRYVGVAFDVI